jgi:hypothetical protein
MARVSMVTRTITSTELEVLCMNVAEVKVETIKTTLLGGITDNDTMLKKVKEKLETETLKPVHITSAQENETLYGMTEEDFIKIASVLPPRKGQQETADEQIIDTEEQTNA